MKFVTVNEMKAIEEEANQKGLTYELMMENAGRNLGEIVEREYSVQKVGGVLGLIGAGNNGGDTLVALAYLLDNGWRATAYMVKKRDNTDPLVERLLQKGGKIFSVDQDEDLIQLKILLHENDVVLDGILGTGFHLPLRPDIARILKTTKDTIAEVFDPPFVVAVDCPSGVDCDTGDASPEVIPANLTVTMAAIKIGMMRLPAFKLCGKIELAGIGNLETLENWIKIKRFIIDSDWIDQKLPARPEDSHKGTFGTTLIIAGSKNYTGAAYLAAKAAYLSGCGLVTLAAIDDVHHALAGQLPEVTWIPLPDKSGFISEEGVHILQDFLPKASALLIGPGFGLHSSTERFLHTLFEEYSGNLPALVIDADGLKLLARLPDWPGRLPQETILTPHPGEMSVLTQMKTNEIQLQRVFTAEHYANLWNQIVILKGAFSIVAEPHGRTAMNPVASSALAKAGTGDVLAGLITGLRAQGVNAFDAAAMGVWIHAQAGLFAADKIGTTRSVLSSDILQAIPEVFHRLENK